MSLRTLMAAIVMLGAVACAETPAAEPDESMADQSIGIAPNCPVGESVVDWTEPVGLCGGCTTARVPGQVEQEFMACSGDIVRTKRPIQRVCEPGCPLN